MENPSRYVSDYGDDISQEENMYQNMLLLSAKKRNCKYEKWAMRKRMMRCDPKWPHCAF
jgi:hypothetical protein